jgi:DNA-binding HxlR family transcriptional regulator
VTELHADVEEACPIDHSLNLLGQKWTLLIIREVMKGAQRFSEFEEVLGCPRNLLATRLRLLCEHDILQTVPYADPGQRGRLKYELTAAGRELAPTLIALFDWGTKHTSNGGLPWIEPSRCRCGAQVHSVLECESGHRVDDVVFAPRRTAAAF